MPSALAEVALDATQKQTAERYGTPLFYYSLPALRAQIERLRQAMVGYPVRLLFATMANDRAEILRAIADAGVGACINSIPHLHRAIEHGFAPETIQFTSCGLPLADMTFLRALDLTVNLDSPSQIQAWCGLRRRSAAGARINAASLPGSTAPADRIGMDLADFERARAIAHGLGGRVNGVHVYAGTNFQEPREMLPILRGIFDLARRFPDLDYVNIGGGIGVDYAHAAEFDYATYGREVCALAWRTANERGRPLTLVFEPGRSLVASSGWFITRVTDIKTLRDTRFVVVDGSVALFPRPFVHPGSFHRVRVLGMPEQDSEPAIPSTIVGRTTFSRDILGACPLPASIEVGALLAFEDAGAYCDSMRLRFLGQREPITFVADA